MFENQISNLGHFQGVQLESDISIITLDDGINHTYCSKIMWEKDNRMAIGSAKIIMPYDTRIAAYWIKYSGGVVIHANLNSHPQSITQAMMSNFPNSTSLNLKNFQANKSEEESVEIEKDEKTNQLHLKNDIYNYAYIGKVSKFKQVGKTFIVYLEDLGWKFMQKVPKKFRDAYIAGQTLDDAFQAICEFIGVEFAYSIEDLNAYNFGADGYSVEKDGQVIEDVPTVLSEWANKKEEENEEEEGGTDNALAKALEDGRLIESTGLYEYKNKTNISKTNKNKTKKSTNNTKKSLNSKITNQTDTSNNNTENNIENEDENQNNEENEQQNVNDKIEKYQEEFDKKIKNLFIGNTLYDSNISDPILNYNWITITPKASSTNGANATSNTNSISGDSTTNNSSSSSQNNANTSSNNSSKTTGQSSRKTGARAGNRTSGNYSSKVNTNRVDNTMVTSRRDNTILR